MDGDKREISCQLDACIKIVSISDCECRIKQTWGGARTFARVFPVCVGIFAVNAATCFSKCDILSRRTYQAGLYSRIWMAFKTGLHETGLQLSRWMQVLSLKEFYALFGRNGSAVRLWSLLLQFPCLCVINVQYSAEILSWKESGFVFEK